MAYLGIIKKARFVALVKCFEVKIGQLFTFFNIVIALHCDILRNLDVDRDHAILVSIAIYSILVDM